MPIPDYQTLTLPLLKLAADGKEHKKREAEERIARQFSLTDEERATLLPSGKQPLFDNRLGWARTYLKQAGLLESVRRGVIRITDRGQIVLARNPPRIDNEVLDEFSEFLEFKSRTRPRNTGKDLGSVEVGGLFQAAALQSEALQTLIARSHQMSKSETGTKRCAQISPPNCWTECSKPALRSASTWLSNSLWQWATAARRKMPPPSSGARAMVVSMGSSRKTA